MAETTNNPTILEQVAALFGMQIKRERDINPLPSFAPKIDDDGAVVVAAGGQYGTYVDLDGTVRTEAELVNKYRDMSIHGEIDKAIEIIVNESIIVEENKQTVELVMDELKQSKQFKLKLAEEFEEVLRLLEFTTKQHDVFRRWFIDGRIYYHVIIDNEKMKEGIKELRYLDPRKIRKIREVAKKRDKDMPQITIPRTVAEYYLYTEKGMATGNKTLVPQTSATGVKIAKDSVAHCTSGLTDTNGTMILGHLHKAIRPLNQLRSLEDATVIYRISRAPERRIFYIDVGNLPKIKAEQYVRDMMVKHRNKLVYDVQTGEIRDDRRFMTMLEDYWLPRREGNRGTEITTLPAGQNLGELTDVNYFLNKVFNALNVPIGRLNPEAVYDPGRSSVVTRDEIMFSKFIDRLRNKFAELFLQVLEKQLVLKKVISPEDWDDIKINLKFRYLRDNYFAELKESEIMNERLLRLEQIVNYAGMYFSHEWIRKNILQQTDDEIKEQDKLIEKEANDPQFQRDQLMAGPDAEMGGQDQLPPTPAQAQIPMMNGKDKSKAKSQFEDIAPPEDELDKELTKAAIDYLKG